MTTWSLKKTRGSCPTPTFSIHKNENSKFKATCVCLKLCDIQIPFCSLCEYAQRKSWIPLKTQWPVSQDDFVLLIHITPQASWRCLQVSITEMCFLTYRDISIGSVRLCPFSRLGWRVKSLTTSNTEAQAESLWSPSCKLKSDTTMLYLSLEGSHLILIPSLCVCFWRFHIYFWTWQEPGSEKTVMWCVFFQPPQPIRWGCHWRRKDIHLPGKGQKPGWETKSIYSIFNQNTAERSAHSKYSMWLVSSTLSPFLGREAKEKGGLGQYSV